jgi:hypothetical protein
MQMTIMNNQSGISTSQSGNIEFRSVIVTFLLKPKITRLYFDPKFDFFKYVIIYVYDYDPEYEFYGKNNILCKIEG